MILSEAWSACRVLDELEVERAREDTQRLALLTVEHAPEPVAATAPRPRLTAAPSRDMALEERIRLNRRARLIGLQGRRSK